MKPRWMTGAEKDLGVHEVDGDAANPRIMAMFRTIGADWVKDDVTPWCAAATGAWLEESGIKSTRSALARSYLDWGQKLDEPVIGCVTVIKRGTDPKQGHVGLFSGTRDGKVILLGGNQGDEVGYSAFPNDRVLGYRWPPGEPIPAEPKAEDLNSRTVAAASTLRNVGVVTTGAGVVTTAAPALPIPPAPDVAQLGAWKGVVTQVSEFVAFTVSHWPVAIACLGVYLVISGNLIRKWRVENARQWLKGLFQ